MGRIATIVTLALLAGVAPAAGSVWAGSVADKQDQPKSLGGPAAPDIKRVTVRHDRSIGRVAVRVTYWKPFDREGGGATNHSLDWQVWRCGHEGGSGAPWGTDDAVTVAGYDGQLLAHHAWSPDHTVITYKIENDVFRGRRFDCFTVTLDREDEASAEDPNSSYDEGCDCWVDSWTPEDVFGRLKRRS